MSESNSLNERTMDILRRKIQDLEISNSSLAFINIQLEHKLTAANGEIKRLSTVSSQFTNSPAVSSTPSIYDETLPLNIPLESETQQDPSFGKLCHLISAMYTEVIKTLEVNNPIAGQEELASSQEDIVEKLSANFFNEQCNYEIKLEKIKNILRALFSETLKFKKTTKLKTRHSSDFSSMGISYSSLLSMRKDDSIDSLIRELEEILDIKLNTEYEWSRKVREEVD